MGLRTAGFADVRLTRDWRRVLCVDPGADLEFLQALERDLRMQLRDVQTLRDVLYKLRDLSSSLIQVSESKGCLGAAPAEELEFLAKRYLEAPPLRGGKRAPSMRRQILAEVFDAFRRQGILKMLSKDIPAAKYTHISWSSNPRNSAIAIVGVPAQRISLRNEEPNEAKD